MALSFHANFPSFSIEHSILSFRVVDLVFLFSAASGASESPLRKMKQQMTIDGDTCRISVLFIVLHGGWYGTYGRTGLAS